MQLDNNYLEKLAGFFFKNQGKMYKVGYLTNNTEKLIFHIKYYIDNRHNRKGYVDVSFNNKYNKIKIHDKI